MILEARRDIDLRVALQAPDRLVPYPEGLDGAGVGRGQDLELGRQVADLVVVDRKGIGTRPGRSQDAAVLLQPEGDPADLGTGGPADMGFAGQGEGEKLVAPAASQDRGPAAGRFPYHGGLRVDPGIALDDGRLGTGQNDVAEAAGIRKLALPGDEGSPGRGEMPAPMLDRPVDRGVDGIIDDGHGRPCRFSSSVSPMEDYKGRLEKVQTGFVAPAMILV